MSGGIERAARRVLVAFALLLFGCKASPADAAARAPGLVPVTLGGPWSAAAGKEPRASGAFGYAVALGEAQPILAGSKKCW